MDISQARQLVATIPHAQQSVLASAHERYMLFTGVYSYDPEDDHRTEDRKDFSHLLVFTEDGLPALSDKRCAEFMATITGLPPEWCLAWDKIEFINEHGEGYEEHLRHQKNNCLSDWTGDRAAGEHIVHLLRSEAATWRCRAVRIRARREDGHGVVSKAVSYCLSLRWAGDCAAIWDFAALPLIAFVALGLFLKVAVMVVGATCLLMLLFLGVGLAAHGPLDRPDGIVEAALQRRSAEKNRRSLARTGLTPERYLATIHESMWIERIKAAHRLGVSLDGRLIL